MPTVQLLFEHCGPASSSDSVGSFELLIRP